ncbi:ScbA/BarX family gamma-butyrolactone biosynthesis protein [Streptomyces sp. NPDC047097]|uniref:ScbA/BarX family gamma-butyrolactone biosynthesis protein n=1 Tax=Streptomyces sp. NPDC047097 TaxID=3155260 RepID=UPI0033D18119
MTATTLAPATVSVPSNLVPREFVHRASFTEVFLTGWRHTGTDTFTVTAQWPRRHSFYTAYNGLHDPLLLCETIRQCLPLLSHAAYDVPFGHRLSWDYFRYTLNNHNALRIGVAPTELELRVTCSDLRRRGNQLTAISMRFEIFRDSMLLGVAETRFGCYSPAIYRRLRADHADLDGALAAALAPAPPVDPRTVGRYLPEDVVLSPGERPQQWQLRSDPTHPVLFDHPVDHAPGMLLLEAVRQAASHEPDALPVAMDVSFFRYVEYDSPCWISAEPGIPDVLGRPRLAVTARQDDQVSYSATVTTEQLTAR